MNMIDNTDVPPGYRRDARGRLIAEAQIKPIDKLRDELVSTIVDGAKATNAVLASFRHRTFEDIAAFVSLSVEQYGVRLGGTKGNVSLLSFDGKYKVQRAIAESIVFDERLQAAKELIDACLREWSAHAAPELITIVNDAFRVDQAGNIRVGSVLSLRRHDIKDERWLQAMKAISEAVQVTGSKSYLRVYERNDRTGAYEPIALDVAGV